MTLEHLTAETYTVQKILNALHPTRTCKGKRLKVQTVQFQTQYTIKIQPKEHHKQQPDRIAYLCSAICPPLYPVS